MAELFWITYVVIGMACGLVFGYLSGHKQGQVEGREHEREIHRGMASQRGYKAAATRRANRGNDAL